MPAFLFYTWQQLKKHPLRALLVLFFFGRLIGITNPPLEVGHSWRQTTVAMVARNFYEGQADILHPRVDMAGELSGITGMEFPLLNYLIHWMSELFGYSHWYGRLIVLVIGSLGVWSFYRLVSLHFNDRLGQTAGILLLGSLWFSFSRKMMPDVFSISLILMGLERLDHFLRNESKAWIGGLSLILLTSGALSKLPSAYLLYIIPLLLWQFKSKASPFRLVASSSFLVLVLGTTYLWYGLWVPNLVGKFGYAHFFMGDPWSVGLMELLDDIPGLLKRFYQTAMGYIGFIAFLSGIVALVLMKDRKLAAVLSFGFLGFFLVMVKAGWAFAHHNYYILPFIPIMATIAGYGLIHWSPKKVLPFILAIFLLEGVLNQLQDFRIKPQAAELLRLEQVMDEQDPDDGLVFINSSKYPTPMYFAHRKGWIGTNQEIKNKAYRDSLVALGLEHVIILKRAFGTELHLPEEMVYDDEDFCIYRLAD